MRVQFTAGRIESFVCPPDKAQAFLWDSDTKGLGLKASPGGSKQYVLESRLHGKTIRLTIGDRKTWSIKQAQTEARRLQSHIDQGIDPRQQQISLKAEGEAKKKEATRRELTVADAWLAYIESRRQKWSARHLADHENLAYGGGRKTKLGDATIEPGALAALMTLKLAEIDAERVKSWLRDEAVRRPTQAALAFRLLRAFLNWCSDTPDYKGVASPDACLTRVAKDVLPKKIAKSDYLQREQLTAWFSAVRSIRNQVISAYLQTLLLTGARREELAELNWDDLDFRWQSITIRDKVDGQRMIPLTPYVASLLTALPRRNGWVFSSPAAKSGRLQEPRIQHNQALAVAGIPSLSLHGLRRSFKSLSEWIEMPVGVVAQVMGHKPSATAEKHYTIRPLDLLRVWHSRYEAWLLEQAGVEFVAKDAKTAIRAITIA